MIFLMTFMWQKGNFINESSPNLEAADKARSRGQKMLQFDSQTHKRL